MRFHALLLVRDEADIIEDCLAHAATWCDAIYVYDTGSTDGTWELVLAASRRDHRVMPIAREAVFFADGLRAFLFDKVRDRATDGDWFVRLDADEFYPISPTGFVKERLRPCESLVCNQNYEFRLTFEEAEAYRDADDILADRRRPIQERRRFFIPLEYAEPRLFRYRHTMQWSPPNYGPWNAGYVARERIPVLHYPHRDPVQLRARVRLRAEMRKYMRSIDRGQGSHWEATDWSSFLVPQSDPRVVRWEHGAELPAFRFTNHLAPPKIRVLQRLAHGFLLPVLDRRRPRFPPGYLPEPIPPELSTALV
jgi:hypothetical protein